MGKNKKQEVAKALIQFAEKLGKDFKKEKYFTPNQEADKLIWNNPLAYLFAVILDQSMKAEKVWEIPFLLKQRLGHLSVRRIADIDDNKIIEVFDKRPKLHRFPKTMALGIKKACYLLLERYEGNAENIWRDSSNPYDIQNRFGEFEGIGQKKASMAVNILVRDFGIEVKDKKGINVSYDIHVRRVFLRTGLSEKDDMNLIIKTAKLLNSDYPGILDNPCWVIGRKYCHPNNPKCNMCPISRVCPKLININLPKSA